MPPVSKVIILIIKQKDRHSKGLLPFFVMLWIIVSFRQILLGLRNRLTGNQGAKGFRRLVYSPNRSEWVPVREAIRISDF